jgi:hypothetical protein
MIERKKQFSVEHRACVPATSGAASHDVQAISDLVFASLTPHRPFDLLRSGFFVVAIFPNSMAM